MLVAGSFCQRLTLCFLTLMLLQPFVLGNSRTDETDSKQTEVKVVPKKKTLKSGETLEVRVEIWNVGSKILFINREIYNPCALSPLSLRLELGPKPKPRPGYACASDCIFLAKDTFSTRLLSHWTTLSPRDFYGTVVVLDPDSFPQLNTPGRWRLLGTYRSAGDLSASPCMDTAPIPDIKEQIKGLPFEGWQGEVDTNTVWIEVLPAKSSGTTRKPQ